MEKAYSHVQLGGKAEPVGRWALNVLRKFSFDEQKVPEVAVQQTQATQSNFAANDNDRGGDGSAGIGITGFLDGGMDMTHWGTETLLEQEFPSLEEMFLGF